LEKHDGEVVYLFAAAMEDTATTASFKLSDSPNTKTASVLGEDRTIEVVQGRFIDEFKGYDVHIYRVE
jgi:hypothetical protein